MAHTPLALMSSLASADVLAVFGIRVSPDKGTSAGSTHTSLHTSLRRLAEMFLNSLCLEETNPPFLHEKAWLRSKLSPQTHFDGIRERGQLNLKFRASQNSCLVSTWPLSSRGKLVSQFDDPDSRAISLTCFGHHSFVFLDLPRTLIALHVARI